VCVCVFAARLACVPAIERDWNEGAHKGHFGAGGQTVVGRGWVDGVSQNWQFDLRGCAVNNRLAVSMEIL
jgi:hypothetical protein